VGGINYSPLSMEPLKNLGLDPQKATELAVKLHAHLVQYAYKGYKGYKEKTFSREVRLLACS